MYRWVQNQPMIESLGKGESHRPPSVDGFIAKPLLSRKEKANPTDRSRWIVHTPSTIESKGKGESHRPQSVDGSYPIYY